MIKTVKVEILQEIEIDVDALCKQLRENLNQDCATLASVVIKRLAEQVEELQTREERGLEKKEVKPSCFGNCTLNHRMCCLCKWFEECRAERDKNVREQEKEENVCDERPPECFEKYDCSEKCNDCKKIETCKRKSHLAPCFGNFCDSEEDWDNDCDYCRDREVCRRETEKKCRIVTKKRRIDNE